MRFVLLGLLVCAGCATPASRTWQEEHLRLRLQVFEGKSISEMMSAYGMPTSTGDLPDGHKLYEFARKHTFYQESGGGMAAGGVAGVSHEGSGGERWCTIRATAKD